MRHLRIGLISAIFFTIVGFLIGTAEAADSYEVWALDQSADSQGDALQGILYVYRGSDWQFLRGAAVNTHKIDLHDASVTACGEGGLKPHMTFFNNGASHMVIGHASSGHVTVIDANSKAIVDVKAPGGNSHAAIPTQDNRFIIVADIGGQKLHRISTNFNGEPCGGILGLVETLDLSLAINHGSGNSLLQDLGTDNARPICPIIDSSSTYAFATLGSGGLAIVDITTTPMRVIHAYPAGSLDGIDDVAANGCGGIEHNGVMYINSGNASPEAADFLYALNLQQLPDKPAMLTVPYGGNDSHGMLVAGNTAGAFLWSGMRASNSIHVHKLPQNPFGMTDPGNPLAAVNIIDLAAGGRLGQDPAPDLIDISPSGRVVFIAQRGPIPLSANNPQFNNAVGDNPGVGVVALWGGGKYGIPAAHYSSSHLLNGHEMSDIHALRVRK